MSNWGISPNASEKEKIKADYADILHGMNSTGAIPYDVYSDLFDDGMELFDRMYEQGKADAIEIALKDAPTIEAEPVRHGRWVGFVSYYGDEAVCSECKHAMCVNEPGNGLMNVEDLHYCPNCGAKMDGDSHGPIKLK